MKVYLGAGHGHVLSVLGLRTCCLGVFVSRKALRLETRCSVEHLPSMPQALGLILSTVGVGGVEASKHEQAVHEMSSRSAPCFSAGS